jgi:hypothetical protein
LTAGQYNLTFYLNVAAFAPTPNTSIANAPNNTFWGEGLAIWTVNAAIAPGNLVTAANKVVLIANPNWILPGQNNQIDNSFPSASQFAKDSKWF